MRIHALISMAALAASAAALAVEPPPPMPEKAAPAAVAPQHRPAHKAAKPDDENLAPSKEDMERARRNRGHQAQASGGPLGADIQEIHQGNRVREVIVTPGLTHHAWSMENTDNPEVGGPGKTGGKLTNTKQFRIGF